MQVEYLSVPVVQCFFHDPGDLWLDQPARAVLCFIQMPIPLIEVAALFQAEKEEPKEKKQKKLLQPPKSTKAIFTVQAGSFTDLSRAETLKTRIRDDGYNAYIAPATLKKGKVYKVCIGKFIEKRLQPFRRKLEMLRGLRHL